MGMNPLPWDLRLQAEMLEMSETVGRPAESELVGKPLHLWCQRQRKCDRHVRGEEKHRRKGRTSRGLGPLRNKRRTDGYEEEDMVI